MSSGKIEEDYDLNKCEDAVNSTSKYINNESFDEDHGSGLCGFIRRESILLRSCLAIVLLLNIPFGRYVLYPLLIFSTWIHEMCHALAALMVGGRVSWLRIYADGSGLAFYSLPVTKGFALRRGFVASGGYAGTAITGGLLLILRRSRIVVRWVTLILGVSVILSVALLVRNPFGMASLIVIGVTLLFCAYFLPSSSVPPHPSSPSTSSPPCWLNPLRWCRERRPGIDDLYAVVAITVCLNSASSIRTLFGSGSGYVAGVLRPSDASTMADLFPSTPYWFWATIWLLLSILSTLFGLAFPFKARNGKIVVKEGEDDQPSNGEVELFWTGDEDDGSIGR